MTRLPALLLAALLTTASASAQTTYTYEYDQYGRLVRVERDSGTSSRVRYTYDSVDNRTTVKQGVSAPTAFDDFFIVEGSSLFLAIADITYNDTDADLPFDAFTISAIGGPDVAFASIGPGGQSITIGNTPRDYHITYTITDNAGLSSTAHIYVTLIPPITCPPECF